MNKHEFRDRIKKEKEKAILKTNFFNFIFYPFDLLSVMCLYRSKTTRLTRLELIDIDHHHYHYFFPFVCLILY